MARIPHLTSLLGAEQVIRGPSDAQAKHLDAIIGWGQKRRHRGAERFAARHGLPYWRAEDGFLRSVGLGATGEPPLSVVLDDRGIYYDAGRASRIERLLEGDADGPGPLDDPALLARARAAIARIVAAGLSKYNNAPAGPVELGPRDGRPRVLVVDQTRGDLSVRLGGASPESFERMFAAAVAENPGARILVKTHPDVAAGKRRGYLTRAGRPGVQLLADPVNPIRLLEQVDRVYVVTSQLGLEALLVGKPVACFGAPFYAGWGPTDDRQPHPRRSRRRTVEQLFAASYLLYARYVHPETGQPCGIEPVIEHLALQRARFADNRGTIYGFGFRVWKHGTVRAFLRSPGNRVVFARDAAHAEQLGFRPGVRAVAWGRRAGDDVRRLAERCGVPLECIEDGFIRSVGLGSDLVAPASLVCDRTGIYYDPTRPSDLETILQTADFGAEELERAAALRRRIVATGLSKYNVGRPLALSVPAGRRVILVPGQVEDDASIELGCRDVNTNLELLRLAREAEPDAFLVYKPHPDVLSGNRRGAAARDAALALCDHIEEEASLAQCLDVAHGVHTLTSLVGFEALLRGLPVACHGQPFYSGWGLTRDRHPVARRTRRLELDELVAGTLLRYPIYLHRASGRFTTPEAVIDELVAERDAADGARDVKQSWTRRQLRKLVHAYRGLRGEMPHAP